MGKAHSLMGRKDAGRAIGPAATRPRQYRDYRDRNFAATRPFWLPICVSRWRLPAQVPAGHGDWPERRYMSRAAAWPDCIYLTEVTPAMPVGDTHLRAFERNAVREVAA